MSLSVDDEFLNVIAHQARGAQRPEEGAIQRMERRRVSAKRCSMPNQAEVALAILTLVLAFVAVVGQQLLCVLEWGERLLLALRGRRPVVHELAQQPVRAPNTSDPFRIAATAHDRVERRRRQREARAYMLARLRDLVTRAG
jgi:hypothetical protein